MACWLLAAFEALPEGTPNLGNTLVVGRGEPTSSILVLEETAPAGTGGYLVYGLHDTSLNV